MKITFISDTHNKHKFLDGDLPGGDLLIHAGDISSMGYNYEIKDFCEWFNSIDNYTHKVFIAGNHDWGFIDREPFYVHRSVLIPKPTEDVLIENPGIKYLRDELYNVEGVNVYGSPWQPEFYDWAFNLPRKGEELKRRWANIPDNTDILVTHGPAYGYVDKVLGRYDNLGCELLIQRIKQIKPKIHVCGHIHSGRNLLFDNGTLYINASVLNERYEYNYKPITIDFNFNTLEYNIINI
jgi:Icc-related predicted phosphoesterase